MKMREFMNALDQTVDLNEAEDRITEMSPELSEAPVPDDWKFQEKHNSIVDAVKMLRARIRGFDKLFQHEWRELDDEAGDEWAAAHRELTELYEFLADYDPTA